jgi:hypothetical protein
VNLLQLSGEDPDGKPISCTGQQIARILEAIIAMPDLRDCTWYAAALDAYPRFLNYGSSTLEEVTCLSGLTNTIRATGQFLDGILAAVPSAESPEVVARYITADGPMNKVIQNSSVEIHAHDTTWIEVYTDMPQVLQDLQNRFGGRIVESQPYPPDEPCTST